MPDSGLPNVHFGVVGNTRPTTDGDDTDVPISEEELGEILGFDPFADDEED